jgi:hypothetical protein
MTNIGGGNVRRNEGTRVPSTAFLVGNQPWLTHAGAFEPSPHVVVRVPRARNGPQNKTTANALKKLATNIYLNLQRTFVGEHPENRVKRIRAKIANLKRNRDITLKEEDVIKLLNTMRAAGSLRAMGNKHHRKQLAPFRAPVS